MADNDLVMEIGFIQTLDDLCTEIHEADDKRRLISSVHVAPRTYEQIAQAKAKQHLSRGNPLLLLGLDLVRDEDVPPGRFSVR